MTKVWEAAPCRENSLIVLLALADWANDDGECWPSMQKLADKARVDRRSAQRIVRKLASDNLITIEEGGGRAKQHKYQIQTAALCRPLENGDFKNSDISDMKRATLKPERATFPPETATPVSPDPLVEPSDDPSREPSNGLPYHGQAFIAALTQYEQHRKEIRKPLKETGRHALYAQLALYGEQGATRSLITSVANGWTGVFPPRGNGRGAEGLDAVKEVLSELEH